MDYNLVLLVGMPAAITTVDKYQGQQNDYVLLSLVRTEAVGHIRDVRRLVVALSRAKLGLYVFCRQQLFENLFELQPSFSQLVAKPTMLQLVVGEGWPTRRKVTDEISTDRVYTVDNVTAMGVLVYQMVQQAQHLQSNQLMPNAILTSENDNVSAEQSVAKYEVEEWDTDDEEEEKKKDGAAYEYTPKDDETEAVMQVTDDADKTA